jgi:hypothetical protein
MAALPLADQLDLVRDGRAMTLPAGATLLFEGDLSGPGRDRGRGHDPGVRDRRHPLRRPRHGPRLQRDPGRDVRPERTAAFGVREHAGSRSGRPDPRRDVPLPDGREPEDRGRRGAPAHARAPARPAAVGRSRSVRRAGATRAEHGGSRRPLGCPERRGRAPGLAAGARRVVWGVARSGDEGAGHLPLPRLGPHGSGSVTVLDLSALRARSSSA